MKRIAGMLLVVLALGGMVWAQSSLLINGAGATFPAPIYSKWFDEYHKANGSQFNYQSVGSGSRPTGQKTAPESCISQPFWVRLFRPTIFQA
jgi:ABC-type phosphate transport system substrate-binding protein